MDTGPDYWGTYRGIADKCRATVDPNISPELKEIIAY